MTRAELAELVTRFTDAFNREDLDGVMAIFAEDARLRRVRRQASQGKREIRAAFAPQFRGAFGRMRFVTEDLFVDPDSGKALIRWLCTLERDGKMRGWRGLDIVAVRDGKIVEKLTYAKAERLKLDEVGGAAVSGPSPRCSSARSRASASRPGRLRTSPGLEALYLAWCRQRAVRQRAQAHRARQGREPSRCPAALPDDFLSAWLEHGTGGTCWPSSNGLHALVAACGFDVRRISASMFDRNDHNHGSLIVRLDGQEWMVDSSIENDVPILLERGVERTIDDPVHPIRVEPVGDELPRPLGHGAEHRHHAVSADAGSGRRGVLSRALRDLARLLRVQHRALRAPELPRPARLASSAERATRRPQRASRSRELSDAELREALVGELGYSESGSCGSSRRPPASRTRVSRTPPAQLEPEALEPAAARRAHLGRVLADAGGEDERVDPPSVTASAPIACRTRCA